MRGHGGAPGKIILLGEHAVVFGEPALAASLPFGLEATVEVRAAGGFAIDAPTAGDDPRVAEAVAEIAGYFGILHASVGLRGELPAGGGLGSSAAFAVALARACAEASGQPLSPTQLDVIGLASERRFHGTPSGVDHSVCARGGIWLYRRGPPPLLTPVKASRALPIVVGLTGRKRRTRGPVASLGEKIERDPNRWRPLVARLGALAEGGARDVEAGSLEALGAKMNEAHGVLAECELSCESLELIVQAARRAGALGAKLTGAGQGGAAIALAPDPAPVLAAIRAAGFEARFAEIR